MRKRITVFTPTYNRKHTLPALYKSLTKQTVKDFVWLIIDDGSSDGTEDMILEWQKNAPFEIRYFRQENGGKMRAHNKGVQMCDTDYFVCVDSDDFLVNEAIEKIYRKVSKNELDDKLAGIIAYKGIDEKTPIGGAFPNNILQSTLSGLYKKGFVGDTTLIFKTDVIRQYPFPVLPDEKFITEAYTYDQIDFDYEYFLLPEVLTICKYQDDGYTQNAMKLLFDNPGGWALYSCQNGNIAIGFFKKIRHYAMAHSYRRMQKGRKVALIPNKRSAFLISYPIGCALYIRRMIKYNGGKNCGRNSRKRKD